MNKPAVKIIIAYREALENLWFLDELSPWIEGEDLFRCRFDFVQPVL